MVFKPSATKTERRFRTLLDDYTASRGGATAPSDALLCGLLDAFQAKLTTWRKSQEKSASDFNLLDTLKILSDETKHSLMLEWLLDHRIERAGTHAQGRLGFRLFLEETGLHKEGYAETDYFVSREVRGAVSRVDIEVAASDHFIIHIENKIHSGEAKDQKEREDQTQREWKDLQRRARHLAVKPDNIHGFFITLSGEKPSSDRFQALPWHRIADILDRFATQAKAREVSLFADHYARALRRMTIQQIDTHDEDEQTDDSPRP